MVFGRSKMIALLSIFTKIVFDDKDFLIFLGKYAIILLMYSFFLKIHPE